MTQLDGSQVLLSVVIPAFNEEARLAATLQRVVTHLERQPYTSEVLVVDDGSTDATADITRGWASGSITMRLVQHPDGRNHGKGAAVRRGVLAARGTYRLFMDSDNSTSIEEFDSFLPRFEQGYDVVIGSRRVPGAHIETAQSWLRVVAGWLGNRVIRAVVLPGYADTQVGFKAFGARSAEVVFSRLAIDRWAFDVEILVIAKRHGLRVYEAPVVWVNSPDSRVAPLDYMRFLRDLWRVRRNLRTGVYD